LKQIYKKQSYIVYESIFLNLQMCTLDREVNLLLALECDRIFLTTTMQYRTKSCRQTNSWKSKWV